MPEDIPTSSMERVEPIRPPFGKNDCAKVARSAFAKPADERQLEGSGRTVVSKKRLSDKEAEAIMPTVMLVETPTSEALDHYLTVEKSGCLGGG